MCAYLAAVVVVGGGDKWVEGALQRALPFVPPSYETLHHLDPFGRAEPCVGQSGTLMWADRSLEAFFDPGGDYQRSGHRTTYRTL